jgi:hypothetical protein
MWKEASLAYFITQHTARLSEDMYSHTKNMGALCPSEMLVILNQTARCHTSDDSSLHVHHREKIESWLRTGWLIAQMFKFVPQ